MEGLGAPGGGRGSRGLRGARAVPGPGAAGVSRAGCPRAWRKRGSNRVTRESRCPKAPPRAPSRYHSPPCATVAAGTTSRKPGECGASGEVGGTAVGGTRSQPGRRQGERPLGHAFTRTYHVADTTLDERTTQDEGAGSCCREDSGKTNVESRPAGARVSNDVRGSAW